MSSCVQDRVNVQDTSSGSRKSFVQNQWFNNQCSQQSGGHDTRVQAYHPNNVIQALNIAPSVNRDLESCVGGKDSSLRRVNNQSRFVEGGPFSLTYIEQVMLHYQKYAIYHKMYASAET